MKALFALLTLLVFTQHSYAEVSVAYSTISPLTFVVESVVGSKVKVKTILHDGKYSKSYKVPKRTISDIKRSKILFILGNDYEKRLIRQIKKTPGVSIVNVGEGIERRNITVTQSVVDEEFSAFEPEKDIFYWLSPDNVELMAKNVYRFMASYDAPNREFYRQNHDELLIKVREIDAGLKESFKDSYGKEVFVMHPSFGYFLERYGLKQVSIIADGKAPTSKRLYKLIDQAKKAKASYIFAQPNLSKKAAKIIARRAKAKIEVISAMEKDILKNWETIGQKVLNAID